MQEKPVAAEDLFQHYEAANGVFDEMEQAPATPRPHWRGFVDSLRRLGRQELAMRWKDGRRIIRDHGVTYNVYGDPLGMDRPWELDLVPLLVPAKDWAQIEAGLGQRSRLFNLILADLYGGQQWLLRDGFLPPELVYANPGFLRPCRGIPPPAEVYLQLLACDLGRSPDGQWWVLDDRTQAPSGTGYALENRTILSRILPDEMREHNVQRLANFFRTERDMLLRLAPQRRDTPSIVLLTPGPHHETYFEHAYFARYLGLSLVEGADLTVRDRRVFLKTLEGLQPVDVIVRRVDDGFCDPLELNAESLLGVPGLVEATRAGNVTLANALGAGLLESPAFLAFMPSLCRHLLGEELLMPSVATWWCGQCNELRYVLEHLDDLVIKPAFALPGRRPWYGGRLSVAERAWLIETLHKHPRDYVAQEQVGLSRAPVWVDNHFEARPVVLRTYVANGGDTIAVMPGGLTRVSKSADEAVISMQHGGGSKDTWVLANGATIRPEPSPLTSDSRLTERASPGVASRAADNLFWLGRYTERLEQTLRLLRCAIGRLSDATGDDSSAEVMALAEFLANLNLLPLQPKPALNPAELQQQLLQLLYHPSLNGGVRDLIGRIRLIATTVRDRFSGDTWRILGRLEGDARTRPGRRPLANASALIHNLVLDLAAFSGMEMENMTRGHGWRFLDLGRRLERAVNVLNLLRAAVSVRTSAAAVLEPLLEIADSAMTYRRRYFVEARLPGVLELLLCDTSNPRGLGFQLEMLCQHARELPREPAATRGGGELGRLKAVVAAVAAAEIEHFSIDCAHGRVEPLQDWLAVQAAALATFSDELTGRYFSHTASRVS